MRVARDLDVRPILTRGEEPFATIMRATEDLEDDEALHLIAPFEPRPLYDAMRQRGYTAHTTGDGSVFHVWFYREIP
ncbi:MAG: DUF2249 domain-containing protein [Deltaproteobacteria bacterium]|nr:DUF2249 domain-containing protein [Deltaproteobacteria bacterium]